MLCCVMYCSIMLYNTMDHNISRSRIAALHTLSSQLGGAWQNVLKYVEIRCQSFLKISQDVLKSSAGLENHGEPVQMITELALAGLDA